jgi:hypothetical protein
MFLLALLAGVVLIVGCGGAGQGISSPSALAIGAPAPSGVSPAAVAHDQALVGKWMIVDIEKSGNFNFIPCRLGKSWPAGTSSGPCVREVAGYYGTGAVIYSYYDKRAFTNAGAPPLKTETGTWSTTTASGLSYLTVTIGTTTTKRAYTVKGDVLTLTSSAGYPYGEQWANNNVPLTAHDPALAKTWLALPGSISLDGAPQPVSYLTGSTSRPLYARSFLLNTGQGYLSQSYSLNTTETIKLPLAPQPWATGGGISGYGVVKYLTGFCQYAIYSVLLNGNLVIVQLDANGETLMIIYTPFAPVGPAHDPLLAGTWDIKSAIAATPLGSKDVLSLLLSQLDPTATSGKTIFWSDGTGEGQVLSGTTLKYAALSTWYTTSLPAQLHSGTFGLATETYVFTDPTHPTHPMSMTWSVIYPYVTAYGTFNVPVTIVLNRE